VNKQGHVVNAKVENSLGARFDAEALRVISQMPDWEPCRVGDRPVKSKVEVPIRFHVAKTPALGSDVK
jgi:periplasmic protein TonB